MNVTDSGTLGWETLQVIDNLVKPSFCDKDFNSKVSLQYFVYKVSWLLYIKINIYIYIKY